MTKTKFSILILCALILSVVYLYIKRTDSDPANSPSLTNNKEKPSNPSWKKYTFKNMGLTLSAPEDMTVSVDSPDSYTFTIQRSAYPDPKYYQLYASLQSSASIDTGVEDGIKNQLLEGSKDLTVGGYKAIQGQYKGERNRYVTFVFTDKGILTLATSQPTVENERTTNSILDTFFFTKSAETSIDTESAVQTALAKKYSKNLDEVRVTITKEVSGFATGSVLFGEGGPGEGGMWIAVLGDTWDIVWDGNGNVDCTKMRSTFGVPDAILKPNLCD